MNVDVSNVLVPFAVVEEVQVSCYRILNSLYFLGTNESIYVERYAIYDTSNESICSCLQ